MEKWHHSPYNGVWSVDRVHADGRVELLAVVTNHRNAKLMAAAPALYEELLFVTYYLGSNVASLGTGEAFQHWDRAKRLLDTLSLDSHP